MGSPFTVSGAGKGRTRAGGRYGAVGAGAGGGVCAASITGTARAQICSDILNSIFIGEYLSLTFICLEISFCSLYETPVGAPMVVVRFAAALYGSGCATR